MIARCALCDSEQSRALFRGEDWLHGQPVEAEVRRCERCGLVYLWPRPENPLDSYPVDYAPHSGSHEPTNVAYSAGHSGGIQRKVRLVSRFAPGPLLDAGCAAGEFLAAVQGHAFRPLLGMDISRRAAGQARSRGLDVWVGEVPVLPLADESLETVTLWHVLEHVASPLEALRDIARVLRRDGVVVVACPMVDSWEARLFGRYWAGYDVPRHLFAFSRQTLPRLLDSAGLSASEVLHVVWGVNSARISSAFWLRRCSAFRNRPRLLHAVATLMALVTTLVFELLSHLFGNRRAVAVFAAHKRGGDE
jgi:SAM-dependent methyltransferase